MPAKILLVVLTDTRKHMQTHSHKPHQNSYVSLNCGYIYYIDRSSMKVEVEIFSDGRLKVLCRFRLCSNFWKDENDSFTYVPTLKQVRILSKTL